MTSLLILSFSRLERDPRVQRQIALFADEHDVITVGFGPAPHPRVRHLEIPDGTRAWPSSKQHLLTRRFRGAYWSMSAVAAARELTEPLRGRIDVVLANDVNSLPLALWLDARLGVHADLHEFSPREKEHDPKWRLFVAPFMRWICRTCLPHVASVTTVSPGLADAYAADYGVSPRLVLNAPEHRDAAPRPTASPLRLLHTGAARSNRSLEVLIDAMDGLEDATLDLMLVESEPGVIDALRDRAAHLPQVRFRDPVPYRDLVGVIAEYDVSVVFFPPTTFNLRHTLPNKLFEAVQARNAVVVSPSPDMAELVQAHGLGVVAEDFTAAGLHRALAALTPGRADECKRAADAAAATLCAERQVTVWAEDIAAIVATDRPGIAGSDRQENR